MTEKYCCIDFEYMMKENRTLTFKILEKGKNDYYIDFFSTGIGHMNWNGDMEIKFCPFCGWDFGK